jgi:hypothetical protein
MKTLTKYPLILIFATLAPVLHANEEADTPSLLASAVSIIEARLSDTDRRAVLAHMTVDRLRSERLWPFGGAAEHAELLKWVEGQWDLSKSSKLGRHLEEGGVSANRRAQFLVDAWFKKQDTGKIDESSLFKHNLMVERMIKAEQKGDLREVVEAIVKEAQQAGTGQPATRPESKPEGSDKPQPEAEGRSR